MNVRKFKRDEKMKSVVASLVTSVRKGEQVLLAMLDIISCQSTWTCEKRGSEKSALQRRMNRGFFSF